MSNFSYVRGSVYRIKYTNGSYHVFDIGDSQGRFFSIAGYLYGLSGVEVGTELEFKGYFKKSLKYGPSFVPISWAPYGSTKSNVSTLLACVVSQEERGNLPPKYSGVSTSSFLSDFENDPFYNILVEAFVLRDLGEFLYEYEMPFEKIKSLYKTLGSEAEDKIKDNPFYLVSQYFSFNQAHQKALVNNIPAGDVRYFTGHILQFMVDALNNGHLYIRKKDVYSYCELQYFHTLGGVEAVQSVFEQALSLLYRDGFIFVEQNKEAIFLKTVYDVEKASADAVVEHIATTNRKLKGKIGVEDFINQYEVENGIRFSSEQKDGLRSIVDVNFMVVAGLPGTGKTTLLKAFCQFFASHKLNFILMAPTGIAAKRIQHVTGFEANTVHKKLRYDGVEWKFNKNNKFQTDVVIVDEFSMVDYALFNQIVTSFEVGTYFIFVGDDAQLPSVSPGNVLCELLKTSKIKKIRLTQIFRQLEESTIVKAAHSINKGEMPAIEFNSEDKEFNFFDLTNDVEILNLIKILVRKLIDKDKSFQVIAPMYAGVVGVDNLNIEIRNILNPDKNGKAFFGRKGSYFREGDRILITKNDYKIGLFNGDLGKIVSIRNGLVFLEIYGLTESDRKLVQVESSKLIPIITLGYAITVHKSQGSEFDSIIYPMTFSQRVMFSRNLVYTAITRARNKVYMLGSSMALKQSIDNNIVPQRCTLLSYGIEKN